MSDADLLRFIEDLSERAGDIAMKYFNSVGLKVDTKDDTSPVTRADREADAFLVGEISKHFPSDGIISEEGGTKDGNTDRTWIIDPIDGTKTFIRGVPLWGTLIALKEGDDVTCGVIALPA